MNAEMAPKSWVNYLHCFDFCQMRMREDDVMCWQQLKASDWKKADDIDEADEKSEK